MKIAGATALVTGANRGLGLVFAKGLLAAGAAKVYAGARNRVAEAGLVPLRLDVTSDADVAAAAAAAGDVELLINNAGIALVGPFLGADAMADARAQMEVNYYGPLRMARAFAPVLARNGGGAMVNVLSVASWITTPMLATYAATKSAAWSLTNALRIEMEGQGTQVLGVHAGFIDTDMVRDIDAPKTSPEAVVAEVLAALERGEKQVMVDDISRMVQKGLSADPAVYLGRVG